MPVVQALLCCCEPGGGGPCEEYPTTLLMEWSGECSVTWAGSCAGMPTWEFAKTGFVGVAGITQILDLQIDPFCAYVSECPTPTVTSITQTSCLNGSQSQTQITLAKCISTPVFNQQTSTWTLFVVPLWNSGVGLAAPPCFLPFGGPAAKYTMFSTDPVDPRGVYTHADGQFVYPDSPTYGACNLTVVQDYGFVTIS